MSQVILPIGRGADDRCRTADLQPAQITDYAQRLAPYTSRGPTWPPSYFFHTAEGSLYPSVYQMNIGKMRDAASGMLGGVGERGRLADQPGEGQGEGDQGD